MDAHLFKGIEPEWVWVEEYLNPNGFRSLVNAPSPVYLLMKLLKVSALQPGSPEYRCQWPLILPLLGLLQTAFHPAFAMLAPPRRMPAEWRLLHLPD